MPIVKVVFMQFTKKRNKAYVGGSSTKKLGDEITPTRDFSLRSLQNDSRTTGWTEERETFTPV